ncbi:MAG: amidohydrolase [Desulfurococcales archaeon]|nr:amidohydrolase [Desulfurococcales archaeon]
MSSYVKGFINGRIYTSFIPRKIVDSFVVINGRIVFVGESKKTINIVRRFNGELIDLDERTVLPGFIDAHMHVDGVGTSLNTLDLRGVPSIEELKKILREYAEKSSGRWIIGRGWDQELFKEKRWPTRWDLDEVVRDRPVILTRVCGHAAVVNSKVVELLNLRSIDSPDIVRDESGEPIGVVKENILSMVRERAREEFSDDDFEKFFLDALRYAASQGVTTLGFVSCDLRSFNTLMRIRSRGPLSVRVRIYLSPGKDPNGIDLSTLELIKRIRISRDFGDDYIKIKGFKIIADGSLGARTAWLSEPYSDDPSTSGYPTIDKERLRKISEDVDNMGMQLAIHAIGDKTLDMLIEIYSRLRGRRHRIEHASVVRDDQLERLRELKPVLVVQPHFVVTDWWARERLGEKRIKWLYRFRDFIRNDIPMALSTDAPVEPLNPWETVYAAVSRGGFSETPYYEETKEHSLTLEETLHYYTIGSAYALLEEDLLGSLEVGKYADFIVIDKDPFETDVKKLREIKVLETYVGGVKVFP